MTPVEDASAAVVRAEAAIYEAVWGGPRDEDRAPDAEEYQDARTVLAAALDVEEMARVFKEHVSFYFDGTTYRCSCQSALGWRATEVHAKYFAHQAYSFRAALLGSGPVGTEGGGRPSRP